MNKNAFLLAVFLLSVSGNVLAYREPTHQDISQFVVEVSVLQGDEQVLKSMGLKPLSEKEDFPKGSKKTIVTLFRDGARDEDGTAFIYPRPLSHFFDPLTDDGLTFFAQTSPNWALEDQKTDSFQKYSFRDARDFLYKALTASDGKDREEHFAKTFKSLGHVIHHIQDMAQPQHVRVDAHCDATVPCLVPGGPFGLYKPSRYEYYTDEKREAGELNQFFTGYATVNNKDDTNFLTTARSFWHTQNRNPAAGLGMAEFTNTNFVSAGTNFRGAFQNGQLIARPNARYPAPFPSPVTPAYEPANNLFTSIGKTLPEECAPPNNPCVMAFFASEIEDNYRPKPTADINPRASTASIFDQDLQLHGKTVPYPNLDKCTDPKDQSTCEQIYTNMVFSLNRFNFDAAHEFLIPRAVAYSAGLIDYFFRGRLEAEDAGYTETGISLRVRNAIDTKKIPAWANETLARNGSLTLAYEYKLPNPAVAGGMQTFVGSSAAVAMTEESDLKPGDTSQLLYSFTFDKVPKEAKEVKYRLVFRGKLGEEADAIAVGAVEPFSGFVVTPNYTPADGITGARHIYRAWGEWRLSDKTGLKAGNIDWKGWYHDGKPAKVLSWKGPRSRYVPDSGDPFAPEVYQHGEVFARAPLPVLGAALTRDAQGKEWLIVIGRSEDYYGLIDVVYRRPNKKSESAALHHPTDNPEGWQQIGRFHHVWSKFHNIDVPWFFNGDGTEAQTMRAGGNSRLYRLRIALNTDRSGATFSNEGNSSGTQTTTWSVTCGNGQESRASGEFSAEYNVAVGFRDDKPVFAVVSTSGTSDTYAWWFSGSRGFNRDGNGTTVVRIPDAPDLTRRSTVTQRAAEDAPVVYNSSATYIYSHHLDLRHGLHAVYRSTQDQHATGGLAVCGHYAYACFPIETVKRTGQSSGFGPQTITMNQNPDVTTNGYHYAFSYFPDSSKCNTSGSDTSLYPQWFLNRMPSAASAWAVDSNGNLFASQAKYGDNLNTPTGGMFNYLTEGDPVQLIPGAPAEPVYSNVGLIR